MQRFYFDIDVRGAKQVDDQGIEFADVGQAYKEAIKGLLGVAQHETCAPDESEFKISMRDQSGALLLKATLSLRVDRIA